MTAASKAHAFQVAIIGAGAAGLVTLKTLLEASTAEQPIEAQIFEAEDDIGGTFRYRTYDDGEQVSSRQLTLFSDFRLQDNAPHFMSFRYYVEYLRAYCDHFKLWPHINLNCRVMYVGPVDGDIKSPSRHQIRYQRLRGETSTSSEHVVQFSHIAICAGLHVQPNIPPIEGIEHVPEVIHSSQYKAQEQLRDRHVLVLGAHETGMDISHHAICAGAKSVTMCFRDGFSHIPKLINKFRFFGRSWDFLLPTDSLYSNLFENAYVHPRVARAKLRWKMGSALGKMINKIFDPQPGASAYQKVGATIDHPDTRSYTIYCKSSGAMAYIDRPWQTSGALPVVFGYDWEPQPRDLASDKIINTCTWPVRIEPDGRVVFRPDPRRKDYQRMQKLAPVRPDLVVLATGYRHAFPWLHGAYPRPGDATLREVVAPDPRWHHVAYVGLCRPSFAAIPPVAEQQALWWTALVTGRLDPAALRRPECYRLDRPEGRRVRHGVDFPCYMGQLGRDFGGAPGLWELWSKFGTKTLLCYCLGNAYVSFYRLVGPFASERAREAVEGDIWEVVSRRHAYYNVLFVLTPMVFWGTVNALAWALSAAGLLATEC